MSSKMNKYEIIILFQIQNMKVSSWYIFEISTFHDFWGRGGGDLETFYNWDSYRYGNNFEIFF
jgi:hypothetical protein